MVGRWDGAPNLTVCLQVGGGWARSVSFNQSGRRTQKAARPPPLQSYGAMNREESDSPGPFGPGT